MSGGVTVIGLTPGTCVIEDIRISVPYQTAVQIPAHLAQRSRHLGEAIQQQRVMQLGNALPLPAPPAKAPPLAPILRGRGIAPHNPVGTRQTGVATSDREREAMERELEASRAHGKQLEGINEALQVALTNMTGQLNQIQQTLSGLSLAQSAAPAAVKATAAFPSRSEPAMDDSIPHFIPATTQEAAEVRISIPETTSDSDLSGARGALRSLRKKPDS